MLFLTITFERFYYISGEHIKTKLTNPKITAAKKEVALSARAIFSGSYFSADYVFSFIFESEI